MTNCGCCRIACILGALVLIATPAIAGPDVIVSTIGGNGPGSLSKYGTIGGISGYAVTTVSCNLGNTNAIWIDCTSGPNCNQHPVIGQNIYRYKVVNGAGRFEQIGMSWLKHAFCGADSQGSNCGTCQSDGTCDSLGVGCTDTYGAGLNADQTSLGPRSEVNAATGVYPYPYNLAWQQTGDCIYKRLQVHNNDLDPAQNAGASYFCEVIYICTDEQPFSTQFNNASWREVSVGSATTGTCGSESGYDLNFTSGATNATQQQQGAIFAWPTKESGVTLVPINIPNDGRLVVGYKATSLPNGMYHYEYAIFNLNSDRCAGSFSLPMQSAVLTNIGFHDVDYHSGEPYSLTDWPVTQANGALTWATQTFAQNANANAIRWDTTYTFRFDATTAPITGTATIGLFKPGTPTSISVPNIAVPGPADCNTNGTLDNIDIANHTSLDCNANNIPDECELATNDCNHNGIPDNCEGTDCNTNGVRDFCELTGNDCNGDGILDVCQLIGHDCNTNRVYDSCELSGGRDCDQNGIPDVCQPDCDTNGVIDACENRPDCNHNGIPDNCDVLPHPGNLVFDSGAVNLAIPDHTATGVTSTINVPSQMGTLQDVNLTVHITHPNVAQLGIGLTHGATTVVLWNSRCANTPNMDVTFDDQGLTLNCANMTGAYRPTTTGGTALSAFNGASATGAWSLKVNDSTSGSTGTLTSWSLNVVLPNFPPTSADVNANGVPDECDCGTCRGDTTADGHVDGVDIQKFVGLYMAGGNPPCDDVNHDGIVDSRDMVAMTAFLIAGNGGCP